MQNVALFKERLIARRSRMGLTQVELAEKGKFSPRSVASWETGEADPTLGNLMKLADTLEVSIAWLVGEAPADDSILRDAAASPPWRMLTEKTLRAALSDLSELDEGQSLLHMEAIVGELRSRAMPAAPSKYPRIVEEATRVSQAALETSAKNLAPEKKRKPH